MALQTYHGLECKGEKENPLVVEHLHHHSEIWHFCRNDIDNDNLLVCKFLQKKNFTKIFGPLEIFGPIVKQFKKCFLFRLF
jgi:hypothetical protein